MPYFPGCRGGYRAKSDSCCVACPEHTYLPDVTHSTCVDCPPGSSTSTTGSTFCECRAGEVWNLGRCDRACKDGYVTRGGYLECLRCPLGLEDTNVLNTCVCPEGHVWIWDSRTEGSCKKCSMGTYKHKGKCKDCPSNTTPTASAAYCECKAGEVWINGTCERCMDGYVSRGGSLECLKCPLGSVNNTCKCSKGHVWEWGDENSKGKCLHIISQLLIKNKTLKILVGVLTVISCLAVLILIIRGTRRGAPELIMAPVILITGDDSSEYMELTGAERQPLEEIHQVEGQPPELTMAPAILRNGDDSYEYMALTGAERQPLEEIHQVEGQPLEETVIQIQAEEEEGGEYTALQIIAEVGALEDESHIYELVD